MRKIILILTIIFLSVKVQAQSGQIDSLNKELKAHTTQDTIRLGILNDLAYYYSTADPTKGLETSDNAIELATLLHDTVRLAASYNYKGLNYASQGKDSLAVFWQGKCLAIHKQRNNPRGVAAALHNMGISYSNMSQYARALDCQQQAYDICKKLDNEYAMSVIMNSIGVIHLFLSNYPKALDCYFKALRLYEKMEDTLDIGIAYTNIGLVYFHASELKKSLQYQNASLKIFRGLGDEYNTQNTLANIGNVYSDSGRLEKALDFYHQAFEINKKLDNRSGIASCLMNMGSAYYNANDFINANHYLQKALNLYRQLGNNYGAGQSIDYLVNIYLSADNLLLKRLKIPSSLRLPLAMQLQQEGLKMGLASGNLEIQRDGWENISEIYTREHRFDKALEAYKTHITLRDSIFNDEKRAEITRLTMQYEFDKKEAASKAKRDKEKALAIATISRQKLIKNEIIGGASIFLIVGFIGFIFYKKNRDTDEKKKEAELRAEVADTEMKALRAQMNPHFIFNSLNSVSDFINKHETETADYYLTKFAALMRMILENSEQREIPLADDLKALEIYMQLEALRMDNKFTYQIDIGDNVDLENTLVPPLLLQPFVENSIWHGIAGKTGTGKILIEIKKEEEMISCVVEDNGVGINGKHVKKNTQKSLGMKITSSRIDLLNKIRKANATVKLSDIAEGMRVELKLPLILSF